MEKKPLTLAVKRKWFDLIKSGRKTFEYRRLKDFWAKRLVGREYSKVIITLGYPTKDDAERRLEFPWRGYELDTIQSSEFGPDPVAVFAIYLKK